MKIVIIEDEKYTAKDLERTLLRVDSTIEIVDIIGSVEEGIVFFETQPNVDLIFSDIQLADGLSFDIYEKVNVQTPIIYCTAYDAYALKAFKTLGIDYILKPFSTASVQNALDKFKLVRGKQNETPVEQSQLLALLKQQLSPTPTTPKSILIRQGDKITPLSISQIALFFIQHESVFAFTFKGKKYVVSKKLSTLEELLSKDFYRTNRQHLVSRKAIKEVAHYFNRKLKVYLTIDFKEEILVGKVKSTAFLEWLTQG